MKNKNIIGFVFILSLFFTNIIPYSIQTDFQVNGQQAEIIQLLNLFNYREYIIIFFTVFVFFTTIKFLNQMNCKKRLVSLFSIGFIGLSLITLTTNNFSSYLSQYTMYFGVNNLQKISQLISIFQLINTSLIVYLFIVIVLILNNIKSSLRYYLGLSISNIVMGIALVAPVFYRFIARDNDVTPATHIETTTIFSMISTLAIILFKVFVITETMNQLNTKTTEETRHI